jgi:rhodanese-related sulfurtransferase
MSWISRLFGRGRGKTIRTPSTQELEKRIRQSPLFKDVPEENIARMLAESRTIQVRASDAIVLEGGEGQFYFIILDGKAAVHRRHGKGEELKEVAELGPGQSFGEEALISNSKRNATVQMLTPGVLLQVPKQSFVDYLMLSLVTWLSPQEAQLKINAGARWVDVRDEAEAQRSHLPDAIFLPLEFLRERLGELDAKGQYICYCANGRFSATAAFLMRQRGYSVSVLRGGLQRLNHG